MVYFNSSGETDAGEPPRPSPPGQGCLHRQTLSRGRCGRCRSSGRIAAGAAGAQSAITGRLVCSLLVCLSLLILLNPSCWFPPVEERPYEGMMTVVKSSPNLTYRGEQGWFFLWDGHRKMSLCVNENTVDQVEPFQGMLM